MGQTDGGTDGHQTVALRLYLCVIHKMLTRCSRYLSSVSRVRAGIKFMFLVGGFADSAMLQTEVRSEFQHVVKIIIPNEVSLAVLRGRSPIRPHSTTTTPTSSRGSSRGCRRVGRLPVQLATGTTQEIARVGHVGEDPREAVGVGECGLISAQLWARLIIMPCLHCRCGSTS